MSSFREAIYEIASFCRKADVCGEPRISISFDNGRDAAYFKIEMYRELCANELSIHYPPPGNEFRIYGIRVRIVE